MDPGDVIQQTNAAFADVQYPAGVDFEPTAYYPGEGGGDILRGSDRESLTDKDLANLGRKEIFVLASAVVHYFWPRFAEYAICHPDLDFRLNLIRYLLSGDMGYVLREDVMTSRQRETITAFLRLAAEQEWFGPGVRALKSFGHDDEKALWVALFRWDPEGQSHVAELRTAAATHFGRFYVTEINANQCHGKLFENGLPGELTRALIAYEELTAAGLTMLLTDARDDIDRFEVKVIWPDGSAANVRDLRLEGISLTFAFEK